jgi:two-component system sensor histidine kinase TctE
VTLRRRLLLLLLPALALLLVGGALVDRWVATVSTREAYDRALGSMALAAAAYLQVDPPRADGEGGAPDLSARTAAFLDSVDDTARSPGAAQRYLAVTRADGSLVMGDAALGRLVFPVASSESLRFSDGELHGQAVRMASVALPAGRGGWRVTLAETADRRDRTQHVMLVGKLLVDFAELDLTLLVVWMAVYFGLRPLGRLREQAEAHDSRQLQRFDERGVPGELRPVITSFNRVLELLRDATSAQRRFIADAAHQLRTPVAGLSAQIELLRTDARARSVSAELALLQRGAQTLSHTANQLLSLARAEPLSAMQEKFQPVALDALVRELVERHIERADQGGIDLGAEAAPARIAGDAWLLEDLLANLIDNALKYTPRDGHVTVRSGRDGDAAWLEVEDDGPGIPESERPRVRERFYRRAGSPGIGVGLGLAIVDEIARAHHAHLLIGTGAAGRGTRFTVRFAALD